jgi:hypothetical protein
VSRALRTFIVSLGFVAAVGCGAQGDAGAGATDGPSGSGAGGSSGHPPRMYDNPDDVTEPEIVEIDAGLGEPSCGASSFVAEHVVAETVIEVPEEITEEIVEEVPETVTEEITEQITTIKPTVLYIMFDQSSSMGGFPVGANPWDPAVSALKSFANDAKSAGLGVALQYFPIGGGSCSTGSGYSSPAVPVGVLPGHATEFNKSLDDHSPNGIGTPIEGALRGVTEFCKKYQSDHPDQQCVSVLVTDGQPELAAGCDENSTSLAAIAKSAHDAGVTTFAVGLQGASFSLLDQIALQGGAPDCNASASRYACDVSSGASGLLDALNTIREKIVTYDTRTETRVVTREVVRSVTRTVVRTQIVEQVERTPLPCEWEIPASPSGEAFDRNKVNIRLSSGEVQTTFVHVSSREQCVPNGWHFDDDIQPTRLIACGETCERIEAVGAAEIDILLGCATIGPS